MTILHWHLDTTVRHLLPDFVMTLIILGPAKPKHILLQDESGGGGELWE